MLQFAYRNRSAYDRMSYLFAASSFQQAYRRSRYLAQIAEQRKRQAALIEETRSTIDQRLAGLQDQREEKAKLMGEQQAQRMRLDHDRSGQQNALANLARTNQTLPTLSPGHYSATDAVVITSLLTNNRFELTWTDLRAQSGGTGVLARTGDSRGAATPAWNHRGDTVAYSSADRVVDGRVDTGVGGGAGSGRCSHHDVS